MMPSESRQPLILIAPLGESASVVTQTLNKLLRDKGFVEKVIVLHTTDQKVKKALDRLETSWDTGGSSKNGCYKLFAEDLYVGIDVKPHRADLVQALTAAHWQDKIIEEADRVLLKIKLEPRVVKYTDSAMVAACPIHKGQKPVLDEVPDIICLCAANAFQDALHAAVCETGYDQRQRLVISLAGGRKTMSGAAAIAAQNLRVGLLCHVSDPRGKIGKHDLLQPPLDSYDLIEQPFTDVSEFIRVAGEFLQNKTILEDGQSFRKNLHEILSYPEGIALVSGLAVSHDNRSTSPLLTAALDKLEEAAAVDDCKRHLQALDRYYRLSARINSIILLPKVEGSSIYKKNKWKLFIQDLQDILQTEYQGSKIITISCEQDLFAQLPDEDILRDVLCFVIRQLFSNTKKFVKTNGEFSISYDAGKRTITVMDSGPKLSPGEAGADRQGWGIGLKITRFVLHRFLHATFEGPVARTDGKDGMRFEIVLPASEGANET